MWVLIVSLTEKKKHKMLAWLSKTTTLVLFQQPTIPPSLASLEKPFLLNHSSWVSDFCKSLGWELGKIVSSSYSQISVSLTANLLKIKTGFRRIFLMLHFICFSVHFVQSVSPLLHNTDTAVILSDGRRALRWHKKKIIGKRTSENSS